MTGKMHVLCGATTLTALAVKYQLHVELNEVMVFLPLCYVTVAAGSYAPDIDQVRSHAGMKHKTASKIVRATTGGHRNPTTHSLIVPAISIILTLLLILKIGMPDWPAIGWLVSGLTWIWGVLKVVLLSLVFGWAWGWTLHVLLDLFNGKGCPLLYPLSHSKISLMDIPDHGFFAWLFTLIFSGLISAGIYYLL